MTNTCDMTIGSLSRLPVAGPLVSQVKFSSSYFSEGFLDLRAALRLKPHLDGLTDRRRVRSWKSTPECLYILREGLPGVMPGDCSASGLPKQAPALGRGVADKISSASPTIFRNYSRRPVPLLAQRWPPEYRFLWSVAP